jgi:alpha-N-acetylglucosaminidase
MLKKVRLAFAYSVMLLLLVTMLPFTTAAQLNTKASLSLIQRILPKHATRFIVEAIPTENGKDIFEVESRAGKIVLRGNNGLSVASALYHYLTEYCHCQITWNGTNLQLPGDLAGAQRKST